MAELRADCFSKIAVARWTPPVTERECQCTNNKGQEHARENVPIRASYRLLDSPAAKEKIAAMKGTARNS
jgi:hypothetical protein